MPDGRLVVHNNSAPVELLFDDTVWVADLASWPGNSDEKVWHLDRNGAVLDSWDTPFDASDVDSSLRTTWSLAVGDDGRVWVSGHYDSKVRGYNPDGTVSTEFDTTAAGDSTFTFMTGGSSWSIPYCFGDGTGHTCPCANSGGPGEGCENSSGGGATLTAGGSSSAGADTITFAGAGLIPNQSVLLFSANNAVNGGLGNLFGDGLRCAGGALVRLGIRSPDGSGAAFWGPGLGVKGGWGSGDTIHPSGGVAARVGGSVGGCCSSSLLVPRVRFRFRFELVEQLEEARCHVVEVSEDLPGLRRMAVLM